MLDNEQIALTIVTIIATFGIGYGLSIANDWRRGRNAKRKSIESMIGELNDVVTYVKDRKDPIVKIEGSGVQLHGASFQTASFDSMIYSQIFREFDIETQVKISNFYEKIKVTNLLGNKLLEVITMGDSTQPKFFDNVRRMGENIQGRLKEHQEEVAKLITHLKDKKP